MEPRTAPLTHRPITAEETIALRSSVLRAGRPVEECRFPGDEAEGTVHVGALLDGQVVSIGSMYHEAREADAPGGAERAPDHDAGTAWRLRGMATAPEARRRGAGAAVLEGCTQHAIDGGATLLWCNARTGAIAFYEAQGWTVLGEEFEIPTAGPHFVMERRVR